MGYAVLHIDKARGNDSAMSAHIERTFVPNNVDATRTHLNRELVQFPAGVTNRTEAPQQGTAKAYSGLYKREFTEEDSEIRIAKDEKKRPLLIINGLPITDWCEQKWKQFINRNRSHRL